MTIRRSDTAHETAIVTPELRRHLKAEISRTSVTTRALFQITKALPDGLTQREVNRWIGGLTKAADKAHLDFVRSAWAAIPDATPGGVDGHRRRRSGPRRAEDGWISVTPAMIEHLESEFDRTGCGIASLLSSSPDLPKGLTPRIIRAWLKAESKTALKTEWNLLLAALAALRTHERRGPSASRAWCPNPAFGCP